MNTEFTNTPVAVTINGRELKMSFTANSHIAYEDATNDDLIGLIMRMRSGGVPMRFIRALVWASLLQHQPNETIESVGEWLTMRTFKQIAAELGQAIAQYLPEAQETNGENPSTAPTTTTASDDGTQSIGAESGQSASSISDSTANSSAS